MYKPFKILQYPGTQNSATLSALTYAPSSSLFPFQSLAHGSHLFSAYSDSNILLWNSKVPLEFAEPGVYNCNPNGQLFVTTPQSTRNGAVSTYHFPDSLILSIDVTHGSSLLAGGSVSGVLPIWNIEKNAIVRRYYHPIRSPITSIQFLNEKTTVDSMYAETGPSSLTPSHVLVSGSADGAVLVWDTRSKSPCQSMYDATNTITALSWTPAGLMCASADGNIYFYDVRKSTCVLSHISSSISSMSSTDTGDIIAVTTPYHADYIPPSQRVAHIVPSPITAGAHALNNINQSQDTNNPSDFTHLYDSQKQQILLSIPIPTIPRSTPNPSSSLFFNTRTATSYDLSRVFVTSAHSSTMLHTFIRQSSGQEHHHRGTTTSSQRHPPIAQNSHASYAYEQLKSPAATDPLSHKLVFISPSSPPHLSVLPTITALAAQPSSYNIACGTGSGSIVIWHPNSTTNGA